MTSDAFFRGPGRRLGPFSVVFVDGLHTAEQSHRDVLNALSVLEDGGLVIVHDCNPESVAAAAPTLAEARSLPGHLHHWNGDVFRTIVRLRTRRDLRVVVVDVDQGVGIVARRANDAPLDLTEDEIDALTYADLAANRRHLLGLVPPTDLDDVLAEAPARRVSRSRRRPRRRPSPRAGFVRFSAVSPRPGSLFWLPVRVRPPRGGRHPARSGK